jgi:hypothetical protein
MPDGSLSADPGDIVEQLNDYWAPWHTPEPMTDAQWEAFAADFPLDVPKEATQQWSEIDLGAFIVRIQATADSKSSGLDGWRPHELKALAHCALKVLCTLLYASLRAGCPPRALTLAFTTLLPKTVGSAEVGDLRPLTVFPVILRAFFSEVAAKLTEHLESLDPKGVEGFRPGHRVESNWLTALLDLQSANVAGLLHAAVSYDLSKAFDSVRGSVVWPSMQRARVCAAYAHMCQVMHAAQRRSWRVSSHSLEGGN